MGLPNSLSCAVFVLTTGCLGLMPREGQSGLVAEMVMEVAHDMFHGCHVVMLTPEGLSSLTDDLVGLLHLKETAMTLMNTDSLLREQNFYARDNENRVQLLKGLWGDPRFTCRAILIDLTQGRIDTVLNFLGVSGLRERPYTRVVLLGPKELNEGILFHPCFYNTIHTLYFAFSNTTLRLLRQRISLTTNTGGRRENLVTMFSKCLYCDNGNSGILLLGSRNLLQNGKGQGDNTLKVLEERIIFNGHKFDIVSMNYFPYIEYSRDNDFLGTTVTMRDSLDTRMLLVIAQALNFTYIVREPWDRQWGVYQEETGNWTGIVGTLQYEKADFSLGVGPTATRLLVMEHSRVYSPEPFVIVSLKPQPLPQFFSLIRPYEAEVWLLVFILTPVAGLVLWLVQRAWAMLSEERVMKFSSAFFYSWSILLGDQPPSIPRDISARILLGSWILTCMIVTAAYRSSLIAHLTVQKKFPPINTFQDLLDRKGWRWGRMPSSGTSFTFFNKSSDPVVNNVFMNIEYHDLETNMKNVLEGDYSFLTNKYYVGAIINTYYTNSLGYTPIHVSSKDYPIYAGFSWGFRQGAPFRNTVSRVQQRIIEAGLISYWVDDVIKTQARKIRLEAKKAGERGTGEKERLQEGLADTQDSRNVVLSLQHLQGGFYLMFLGHATAFLCFLIELLTYFIGRVGSSKP